MKIGDLVVCTMVSGRPMGLIVERRVSNPASFNVLISGINITCAFQAHQLEVVNESR